MQNTIKPLEPNMLSDGDYYKFTHWRGYPENITHLYSYGEARKGAKYPFICYYGMTMMAVDHLQQEITKEKVDEAREICFTTGREDHFNKEVANKLLNLGYLPMEIKSAPEGSIIPVSNVLFTVKSNEPWFAKTMNFYETNLMNIWLPITCGTRSMYIMNSIKPFVVQSGSEFLLPYMVHDFSMRGHTSWQSAYRGSSAHLIWFEGTDTTVATRAVENYYGMKGRGKSVWATEHSIATSFGPGQGEFDYLNHQLDNAHPEEIVSIVIDSYDTYNFLQNVAGSPEIKKKIEDRPGRVVFRPDSGDPKTVINRCLEILRNVFGYTVNDKGYKVLNSNVGLLQGDGMNEESIPELYSSIVRNGWSSDNLIVGSGGGLMVEGLTRDTQRFAIKASYGEKDGVGFNIQKDPATQLDKKSKTGQLKLLHTADQYYSTLSSAENKQFSGYIDDLETIFNNGKLINPPNFKDIIERAHHGMNIQI